KCLGESGTIVWLDRSPELLRGTPDRPLSPDDESIRRLCKERLPLYERYADIRINADGQPDEVCAAAAKALERYTSENNRPCRPLLPPDKSLSHRALIAAYLAGEGCRLHSLAENDDVKATDEALKVLEKLRTEASVDGVPVIDCGESASTLRFLLPLFAQTGRRVVFTGKGRLLQRPLGAYEELYSIERTERGIEVSGTLKPGRFKVHGNVSSQIITGLLFLLPLLDGDSVIEILPPIESEGYVEMTLKVLEIAGIRTSSACCAGTFPQGGMVISVPGGQRYRPFAYTVPADWSAAANLAGLSFLTGKEMDLSAADPESAHPDRAVIGFLAALKKGPIVADISGCPDLGPLLFALATQAEGTSRFTGAARLRLKESDRIASMQEELGKLGCSMEASEDGTVLVRGRTRIEGGVTLSSHGDHRVAMALAVLACTAEKPVTIEGAECVSKSWPGFFEALQKAAAPAARVWLTNDRRLQLCSSPEAPL
ncbi:MAG: hypothetical protein IKX79_04080, partial [Desulfovibrionaceae bacterium]|nr:hypothetical protein [Desulfovibrionaceae bacterium]